MNKGKTIWLFGRPCSGKTTLATKLSKNMNERYPTINLDGDVVRKTLCREFGFSTIDRTNNLIRVADVCNILNRQGVSTVCSFVTPLEGQRAYLRDYIDDIETFYVDCPLNVCERRDVKNMYEMARNGEIKGFTGVDGQFDEPNCGNRVLTGYLTVDESVNHIANTLGLYPISYEI